jgi:formiminotetrahydrofolate cyclodeaminase
MREESIDGFLDRLADRIPAPDGGASVALHTAQAGALLAMGARYSDGEKDKLDAVWLCKVGERR